MRHSVLLLLVVLIGCGDGGTSSGGGNIFSDGCNISDPGFPFCGAGFVRCTNQDETLYQVFDQVCPVGWTVVPDNVAFPDLACTNPQGQTFNVDADQCPPGWTEFKLTLFPPGLGAGESFAPRR
ncbi:MAG: hypothetical protein OEU36_04875 [Gammaproteobacteria bacterium]|nr:hypothetical protein [Gammaproteobacteria bacterium]